MTSMSADKPRRSRFGLFIAPVLLLIAAIGWTGFWFYAAFRINDALDGWRLREAKSGRVYDCGKRGLSGFPFRFEIRCNDVSVTLVSQTAQTEADKTRLRAVLPEIVVVGQVYDPQRLIADFSSPATLAVAGDSPTYSASWSKGRSSIAGLPDVPQRISLEFDTLAIDSAAGSVATPLFRGQHAELHGRLADGSAADNPVIEIAVNILKGSVQGLHPLLADPFDSDLRVLIRGLKDFSPKPWPERFREIQAAGGRIDIVQSRIAQGEFLSVAAGSLGISPAGRLNGELQMTVAGIEKVVPALGIDKLLEQGVSQGAVDRVAPGVKADEVNKVIGALNRMVPGIDRVVRQNVGAGLALLGPETTLEGKKARSIPVRFVDGNVFIGPLRIAAVPPLF